MRAGRIVAIAALAAALVPASAAARGAPPTEEKPKLGDIIFFSAFDADHGYELWRTNGTKPGTKRVEDINTTGTDGSFPDAFAAFERKMYFVATTTGAGRELWRSDGTAQGTRRFSQI